MGFAQLLRVACGGLLDRELAIACVYGHGKHHEKIVPPVVEKRGGSSRRFSHHSVLASNPLLPDKAFWRL
jgi:hypothetical protein